MAATTRRRMRPVKITPPKPAPVVRTHPLDGVHPAIRSTVEADVAGRWDQVEVFVVSPYARGVALPALTGE